MMERGMSVVFPDLLDEEGVRLALGCSGKPVAKSTLQRLLADTPDFPQPFTVRRNRRWFAEEIATWINTRQRRQYHANA
jgi:predicted DNA-binding transcriptional regulator AlpA